MKSLPKPIDTIAGIQQFWFVPVNDIALLGDIILNELQSITFAAEKEWLSAYGVFNTKEFSEKKKEDKKGIRFIRSLKLFHPGFSQEVILQLDEMQCNQFLIAFKDNNGLYKIAGTLKNPLNFQYKLITGKSGAEAQGISMEFFAESKIRVVSVLSGEDLGVIPIIYNDWFLPSKDELLAMYTNLHAEQVGDLSNYYYWSSSESFSAAAHYVNFNDGTTTVADKQGASTFLSRACRSFEAEIGSYNLRDVGPAGGLIFYISGNTFYEAAPNDNLDSVWSNVRESLAVTGTAIGTGKENTQAIINQAGHTNSAAKLCDDLIIEN